MFAGLSDRSRYLRFHAPVQTLSPMMRRALVAVDGRDHVAVASGVRELVADVLADNEPMLRVLRRELPTFRLERDGDAVRLVSPLTGWDDRTVTAMDLVA